MIDTPVKPRLEELLEHAGWLRRLAARLVAGPHDADDLVQEVWRATLAAEQTDVRSPRAWLSGALRNVIKMRARGDARRTQREQAQAPRVETPSAGELVAEQEVRRQLLEHVEALPESEREVVLLRFYRDLPPREVAIELGIPVNTVRSRTARALQRLRERLDDQHGDRRAWCLSLVPLLDPRGLQAVGIHEAARRSLWLGAAALAVAVGGYFGYESWTPPRTIDLARSTPANEALDRFASSASEAEAPTPARREVAATAPSFTGKVVDLGGAAIPGALVHFGERWVFDRLVDENEIRAEDWSRTTEGDGKFSFAHDALVLDRGQIKLGPVAHPDFEAELGWSTWRASDAPVLQMRRAFDATVELEVVERGSGDPVRFTAHCQSSWGKRTAPGSNTIQSNDPQLRFLRGETFVRVDGIARLPARIVAGATNRVLIEVPGGHMDAIELDAPQAHGHVYRFRREVTFDDAANEPGAAVVGGRVTDAVSGQAIPGVRVRRVRAVREGRSTRRIAYETQTRTNGSYTLGYDAATEADSMQFDHPGYLTAVRDWRDSQIVDAKLQRKPSLTVRVVEDGRALANLTVLLLADDKPRRLQTDADGRADFGPIRTPTPSVCVLPSKHAADDHALARRSVTLAAGERGELEIELRLPERLSVFGMAATVPGSAALIAPIFLPLDNNHGWVPSRQVGRSGYEAGDMRRGRYLVFLAPTDDRFHDGPFAFGGLVELNGTLRQVYDVVMPSGRVQGRLVGAASWQGLHVFAVPQLPRHSAAVDRFLGNDKLGRMLGAEVGAGGDFSVERVADGRFVLEVRRGADVIASRNVAVRSGLADVGNWQVEG